MKTHLSIVEDIFAISGRGVVVVPGIPDSSRKWRIKIGDPIWLQKPDGTQIQSSVRGIEMICRPRIALDFIPILLGSEITKDDVPIGTELLIEDSGE
jgi:translation elongation factor EF-Tu-like GTPase